MNSIKLWDRTNTIFMNSENSKHLIFTDYYSIFQTNKFNNKWCVALSNLSIYCTWENIKKSYKNNKFKKSAPTWNEEFELPDGSCSVSDIQDYFEYILKNMRQFLVILQ